MKQHYWVIGIVHPGHGATYVPYATDKMTRTGEIIQDDLQLFVDANSDLVVDGVSFAKMHCRQSGGIGL